VLQWRRHVRPAAGLAPGDRLAARLAFRQREVATRSRANDKDRALGSAPARDDDEAALIRPCTGPGENRRRRRDLRTPAEPPQLLSRTWIVAADVVRRVGHQLVARRRRDD